MKKGIAFTVISFALFQANCQEHSSTYPIAINSHIVDTVEVKLNSTVLDVSWLDDTIRVHAQHPELKLDSRFDRVFSKVDTSQFSKEEFIERVLKGVKTGGQNCYSYALEKYFENDPTFSQSLFGESTSIGAKSVQKILTNYFEGITEFSTKPKHNLQKSIPNNTILALFNKRDRLIHFIYYRDAVFYSKNGGHKPMEFTSLKKFLKKHYWDTQRIAVYQVDKERLTNAF